MQQFTADAAHELRTPLAAVQATAESVMRLPEISDADAREMLQVINRQSQRLTHLVSDLLLLSRLDTQAPALTTRCCLQDLLSDIEEELAALALAKNIHLQLNQPAQPPISVMGNEAHLYRLVVNVVSNALQHSTAGGKVVMALMQQDRQAWITVADTGTGIDPEDQARIFDRFIGWKKTVLATAGDRGWGWRLRGRSPWPMGVIFRCRAPLSWAAHLRSSWRSLSVTFKAVLDSTDFCGVDSALPG